MHDRPRGATPALPFKNSLNRKWRRGRDWLRFARLRRPRQHSPPAQGSTLLRTARQGRRRP